MREFMVGMSVVGLAILIIKNRRVDLQDRRVLTNQN